MPSEDSEMRWKRGEPQDRCEPFEYLLGLRIYDEATAIGERTV